MDMPFSIFFLLLMLYISIERNLKATLQDLFLVKKNKAKQVVLVLQCFYFPQSSDAWTDIQYYRQLMERNLRRDLYIRIFLQL